MALHAACGGLAEAPQSLKNRVVRGWAVAGRTKPACEPGDRHQVPRENSIADQLPIHGPPLSAGDDRRCRTLPFPPFHGSGNRKVWILQNTSSVIILRLLSMKQNLAAPHKTAPFRTTRQVAANALECTPLPNCRSNRCPAPRCTNHC